MVAYEGPRPIDAGTNAPEGATVWFWLPKLPKSAGLSILDSRGSVVRTLEPHLRAGLNKSTWDMRYRPAAAVSGGFDVALVGPRAVPGTYRVRLEADGAKLEQDLVIERDPRASATDRDLGEQFKLHLRIRDKLSEVNDAINDIRVAREAGKISARLTSLEGKLMQLKAKSHGEMASYPPMLNNQLSNLAVIVDAAEVAPSESMHEASAFLAERADKLVAEVRTLLPRRSPRARRSRGGNGGQHRDAGRAAALS
jgi:hypothetical protein